MPLLTHQHSTCCGTGCTLCMPGLFTLVKHTGWAQRWALLWVRGQLARKGGCER